MKISKLFIIILVNYFVCSNYSSADQNLKFADIDAIIKNTNIGKKKLTQI